MTLLIHLHRCGSRIKATTVLRSYLPIFPDIHLTACQNPFEADQKPLVYVFAFSAPALQICIPLRMKSAAPEFLKITKPDRTSCSDWQLLYLRCPPSSSGLPPWQVKSTNQLAAKTPHLSNGDVDLLLRMLLKVCQRGKLKIFQILPDVPNTLSLSIKVCQFCPAFSPPPYPNQTPLFTQVSWTYRRKADDMFTKLIIDLQPRVSWYHRHLWTSLCLNRVFVTDK